MLGWDGIDDLNASKLKILIGVVFQVESFGSNVSMCLHEHSDALSHDNHDTGKAQIFASCKVGGNKQIQTCVADVKRNPDKPVGPECYFRDEDNAEEDECHCHPGYDQCPNSTEQFEEWGEIQ